MGTTDKVIGALDEPGMREVRAGVWRLRVFAGRKPNGDPIQKCNTIDSGTGRINAGVREARAKLAKMRAEIEEDGSKKRTAVATGYTVARLIDRYIAYCEQQDRAPTTLHEYRRIRDRVLVPRLGALKVADLDQDHLDALYADLRAQGLKATTIRRVHALISAALRFGMKKRLVKTNVASLASPPPVRVAEVEAPTVEQVRDIVAEAERSDPRMATFLLMAALTGARRGELLGIRWDDVDIAKRTVRIGRSIYKTADGGWAERDPKTHAVRRVSLDPVAAQALRRHRKATEALANELRLKLPADAFVFSLSPQGNEPLHPSLATQRTRSIAKRAGVRTHLHTLRHFHATQAIAGGFDAVTVGARLGHANPTVTLKYSSHAIEARDRDLAAAMGERLALG